MTVLVCDLLILKSSVASILAMMGIRTKTFRLLVLRYGDLLYLFKIRCVWAKAMERNEAMRKGDWEKNSANPDGQKIWGALSE